MRWIPAILMLLFGVVVSVMARAAVQANQAALMVAQIDSRCAGTLPGTEPLMNEVLKRMNESKTKMFSDRELMKSVRALSMLKAACARAVIVDVTGVGATIQMIPSAEIARYNSAQIQEMKRLRKQPEGLQKSLERGMLVSALNEILDAKSRAKPADMDLQVFFQRL